MGWLLQSPIILLVILKLDIVVCYQKILVEEVLTGLKPGAEDIFDISPEKGFGQHNPSNIQEFSRKDFDEEVDLEPGLMLSFADANQAELPGVVLEADAEKVTVDFNHPLAGHTISFKVKVVSVVPAVTH